jgi:hypothetical protein
MKSNHSSPIWPYLAVLACLFAACVLAPRGWQRLARTESVDAFLDANDSRYDERVRRTVISAPPAKTAVASVTAEQPGQIADSAEPKLAEDIAASNTPARIGSAIAVNNEPAPVTQPPRTRGRCSELLQPARRRPRRATSPIRRETVPRQRVGSTLPGV